jgi:ketopantoate reductase
VRENRLTLRFADRETVIRLDASADPADFGPQDYVIIALKSHQAWDSAEAVAPLLGPHTAVVTMQNGLPWWYFYGIAGEYADLRIESIDPDDRQWRAIGPQRVIGGRPLEIDALLTAVQEMGRLVDLQTPYIDSVLALVQQMGRVAGVYPTFPQTTIGEDEASAAAVD